MNYAFHKRKVKFHTQPSHAWLCLVVPTLLIGHELLCSTQKYKALGHDGLCLACALTKIFIMRKLFLKHTYKKNPFMVKFPYMASKIWNQVQDNKELGFHYYFWINISPLGLVGQ